LRIESLLLIGGSLLPGGCRRHPRRRRGPARHAGGFPFMPGSDVVARKKRCTNKRASRIAMPFCSTGLAPPAFTAPCR